MIDAKGVADTVLKGSKPKESSEGESSSLETAVSEFFDAKDAKTRAAAFKAAFAMCRDGAEETDE